MAFNIMVVRQDGKLIVSYRAEGYPTLAKDGGLYLRRKVGDTTKATTIFRSSTDMILIEEVSDENALGGGAQSQGLQL